MNNPEVTMLQAPSNQLNALTTALEAAGIGLAIARRVPAPLNSLADQVVRSATRSPPTSPKGTVDPAGVGSTRLRSKLRFELRPGKPRG